MPTESLWFLLVGGLLCALGGAVGVFFERRRLEVVMREQAARNSDLRARCGEVEASLEEARADNRSLSSFLVVLPDVVKRLNSHMSRRSIPPLLASTLDQLFEPARILVYTTQEGRELLLTAGKGLTDGIMRGHRIPFGKGRIGMVARHQIAVDREDMHSDTYSRRLAPDDPDPAASQVDLIAPMIYEGRTLGVICVGGVTRHHREEKRMIKLVADLGSLALSSSDFFAKLENLANADSLTGLHTKRFLNMKLGELTHRAEETHEPLSLMIFDIDHFKKINDSYGHLAGDQILKTVAALIKGQLRASDVAARYGGEEFVTVLPNTAKEDAVRIAEKIRKAIEQHSFSLVGRQVPARSVTISGGVAALQIDGRGSQEVLSAADQALYLAKEKGRNRIMEYRLRYLSDDSGEELETAQQ